MSWRSKSSTHDLIIIGAGSGGLTAARFAARLGARVALVEKHRIGGDCTWTGCVPSKALLKAAKIAHDSRMAAHYGIITQPPTTDMSKVRDYLNSAINQVCEHETPEELERQGIEVLMVPGRFLNPYTLAVGERVLRARNFLITTGARPFIPPIMGLADVPYITYEQVFDNERLPERMAVIGAGPVGMEIAQAYQRLGSQVTVIADRLLPKEDSDVQEVMHTTFAREGMQFCWGKATAVRKESDEIVIISGDTKVHCDMLFVASGRKPTVAGLDLEKAGIHYTENGIPVDDGLRTNIKHIYAAGDVVGGHQFTHFAGWQAFQAVRNALLPGRSSGFTDVVPWVTFTDPEVAHVGLTETEAHIKYGNKIVVHRWQMNQTDRAVCENDISGFVKVLSTKNGTILGATIVAGRAGEAITEFVIAIRNKMKVGSLANSIHAYPTYSTAVQQLTADISLNNLLSGGKGRIIRGLSGLIR